MKRAIYEWGWMLFAAVAASLLILWAASRFSSFAIEPFDLNGKTYAGVVGGNVFCSSIDSSQGYLHLYNRWFWESDGGMRVIVPGFRFLSNPYWEDDDRFAVEMSLLIPASIAGIVSLTLGILLRRHHRHVRAARQGAASRIGA